MMPVTFNLDVIKPLQEQLNHHAVYEKLNTLADLRCFMAHHIYSVWDFMSMIKYLQQQVAPTTYPWIPQGDGALKRFIHELVLEEESDKRPVKDTEEEQFGSHFELYCQAMQEVGAGIEKPLAFLQLIKTQGLPAALASDNIPSPAKKFTQTTFSFIESNKPHLVAAALALGREKIIPAMFRNFLQKMEITSQQAPIFHFYLNRHIHLDEDFHGPLSLKLLESLCDNDPVKMQEAEAAASQAIIARIHFWDGVLQAVESRY